MSGTASLDLPIVDGLTLPSPLRDVLRPAAMLRDRAGRARLLPRWFYEVSSWDLALELSLTPHFKLWELITVDVREAAEQRSFPRYVPCAITLLAAHLEVLRNAVGTYVHVAANGGYRTPAHALSDHASTHCWATAANVYRIGDDILDSREQLERYERVVRESLPHAWVRRIGTGIGEADDHLHIDIGFVTVVPHDASSDDGETADASTHGAGKRSTE
jgi:hypothetical protein